MICFVITALTYHPFMLNGTKQSGQAEDNVAVIKQLVDAWNSHDAARVQRFYADDFSGTEHATGAVVESCEGAAELMYRLLSALPDYHITADAVHAGENVTLVWRACGTQRGELLSVPATNREVTLQGMTIYTVEHGRIRRSETLWDVAGWLRQIGLLPRLNCNGRSAKLNR